MTTFNTPEAQITTLAGCERWDGVEKATSVSPPKASLKPIDQCHHIGPYTLGTPPVLAQ